MHAIDKGILLKYNFWLSKSGMEPKILIFLFFFFYKLPDTADAACQ